MNAAGCASKDSTQVSLSPRPMPALSSTDSIICNQEERELFPGTFASYKWSTGDTTSTVATTLGGTYTVTVTNDQKCSNETSVTLVNREVTLNIGTDTVICDGDAIVLSPTLTGYDSYAWDDGSSSHSRVIVQGGTYELSATKYGSCTVQDSIHVEQRYVPVTEFDFIVSSTTVDFQNLSVPQFDVAEWYFGDGNSAVSSLSFLDHTYAQSGDYEVTLITRNVCGTSSMKRTVSVYSLGYEELFSDAHIRVYPNPAASFITVELTGFESRNASFLLTNAVGQIVFEQRNDVRSDLATFQIPTYQFARGSYFLQVSENEQVFWKQIILH